jgi:hypothetical protein
MARIRSRTQTVDRAATNHLVEVIVKALNDDPQPEGPVIFEVSVGDSDFLEVIVVWKLWADLPADVRNRIVMEAYERFAGEHPGEVSADRLSMILPVTPPQAIDLGLLPYSVQSDVDPSEPRFDDEILPLLRQFGAIETESGPELRLPTAPMAIDARDRLREATREFEPAIVWRVIK